MIHVDRPQIKIDQLDDFAGGVSFIATWVFSFIVAGIVTKDLVYTMLFGGLLGAGVSLLVSLIVYYSLPPTKKYIDIPLSRRFRVIKKENGIYYLESKFMGKWREVLWSSTVEDEMNTVADLS